MGKQVQLLKELIRTIIHEEAKKGTLNEIWGGPNESGADPSGYVPPKNVALVRQIEALHYKMSERTKQMEKMTPEQKKVAVEQNEKDKEQIHKLTRLGLWTFSSSNRL